MSENRPSSGNRSSANRSPESRGSGISKTAHSRWQGWLIVGLLLAGMVLAYAIFPRTAEDRRQLLAILGTSNKGDLVLPPRQIQDMALQQADDRPWLLGEQKIQWRLLLAVAGDCSDEDCGHLMYTARQVHTRLAEKSPRVERLLVNLGPVFSADFSLLLERDYPGMKRLTAERGALEALLAGEAFAPGKRLYLMDQEGFVMMSYGREHPGGDILKDIKRLLKYSRED